MTNVSGGFALVSVVVVALAIVNCSADSETGRGDTRPDEAVEFMSMHWPLEEPDREARVCIDYSTGLEIPVDPEPLLSLRHFAEAAVEPGSVQPTVRLTEEGTKKIEEITRANIGRRLAVVVDGLVMGQPLIRAPVTSEEIPLVPMRSPEAALEIVERINLALAESATVTDP